MTVTAKMIKELRDKTGAGILDCKNALTETNGDTDLAVDVLRKRGVQLSEKKAGRDTNQGLIGSRIAQMTDHVRGVLVEVNCETDFVAMNDKFHQFVHGTLTGFMTSSDFAPQPSDIIVSIGENVTIGKNLEITSNRILASYAHNKIKHNYDNDENMVTEMGSIGVIVAIEEIFGDADVDEQNLITENAVDIGQKIAMHIAASNPKAVGVDDLDPTFVEHERKLFTEQAIDSGKPPEIAEKMVNGRLQKVLREVTLLSQPFVMNPKQTIKQVLEEANVKITGFIRVEVGE